MLLGLDSTDSVRGGCTTHVAVEVWRRLSQYGVRGGPRLVRLNPNVPYKTRGNGALCLELGHGVGRPVPAAMARGVELYAYREIEEPSVVEQAGIFRTAKEVIDGIRSPASNTGLVALSSAPPPWHYEETVTRHATRPVLGADARVATWGDGRGLIGAVAAAAWPARRGTFELIAYRDPSRWGTRRRLLLGLGAELDAKAPSSFDNWDPVYKHLRVAPTSPCPILAGVRGTKPRELPGVLSALDSEPIESWALFLTNQATGDHLRRRAIAELRPFDAAIVRARVTRPATVVPGGHVFVPVDDGTGGAVAAAYEPTKDLRETVRGLRPGDGVILEAAVHEDPRLLALEALSLIDPVPRLETVSTCPCGGAAPSKGRRSGRVCRRCGEPVPTRTSTVPPTPPRRVTVPVCVRRHLSTPPGFTNERLNLAPGGVAA